MESIKVSDFLLESTLECGQFFRYRKEKDEYVINHRSSIFRVRQEADRLFFSGVPKEFIINFFRLDEDYRRIVRSISKDDFIRKAIKANYGMRMIRQDPWECLISYICSANNNIPRITSNVRMISRAFGKRLNDDETDGFAFPEPGSISDHELLRSCKVGFRSRFIHQANLEVDEMALLALKNKDYETAKADLIKLNGVGDKIADCVCLFALDKLEAFPVDVWVRRVMTENYFPGQDPAKTKNPDIQRFAREHFGKYCGYANQFLFYYRRAQGRQK